MGKSVDLLVLTPDRTFFKGAVEMVVIRTNTGEEGFLPGHSWACKILVPGEMRIYEQGRKEPRVAALEGGFLDVKDRILIFADAAEWPEEIDLERAKRALARAQNRLKVPPFTDEEIKLAQIAIQKAMTRMNVKAGGSRHRR